MGLKIAVIVIFVCWTFAAAQIEEDLFSAASPPALCNLPVDPGPCRALLSLWFYNSATRACHTFTYGGCSGNLNKFWNKEECEHMCKRKQPDKVTVRKDLPPAHCLQEMSTGPCRGRFPRWYFNKTKCQCERFYFGGCWGNANSFKEEEECKKSCIQNRRCPENKFVVSPNQDETPETPGCKYLNMANSDCRKPINYGTCRESHKRYYYDARACMCKMFTWGGCSKGRNHFESMDDCQMNCEHADCSMDLHVGPRNCTDHYMIRYGSVPGTIGPASKDTLSCQPFIYSGCSKTPYRGNNFKTQQECIAKCIS